MRIIIAGSSGLLGTALKTRLTDSGFGMRALVRRKPRSDREIFWNPSTGELDAKELEGADIIINLCGSSIAKPWTKRNLEEIERSRIDSTALLVKAMKEMDHPPQMFINASACGVYGNRGPEILTEETETGQGTLANICEAWETEARKAEDITKVTLLRTGIVLSSKGGAIKPFLVSSKIKANGFIGRGDNYWPWITLEDYVRAVEFILKKQMTGPVNMCAPEQDTMKQVLDQLATHKPAKLTIKIPEKLANITLKDFAKEFLTGSQCMKPVKLEKAGFTYRYGTLNKAIKALVEDQF